ncbi:MAG TPA: hydrogen gas-evolving membrane-bound hydrogenase subunit E, partial [Myxococcota bacterium]
PEYSLALWHGFTPPFVMSLVAIVGGVLVHLALRGPQRRGRLADPPGLARFNGRRAFETTLVAATRFARAMLRVLGTRRLQVQMLAIVGVAGALALAAARAEPLTWGERPRLPASPAFALLCLVGIVCAVGAAAKAKFHRLVAITLMGGAGLVTCLTFVWFSAPDLALTQVIVEVVTTILFLLGLRWLPMRLEDAPGHDRLRDRLRRARDLLLAIGAGGGLAALSYAMLTRPAPHSISPFFLSRSLPEGGGANVVNVMLVDFRAFDTLGEITVLGAVALTVFALLRRFRPARESVAPPRQQMRLPPDVVTDLVKPREADVTQRGYLMVPAVLAQIVLPLALVLAAHLLLRGHDQPGGGFVAGLVVAVAFLLQYVVAGTLWVEARAGIRPTRWIGFGLLLAVATGLGALAFGHPFLTSHTAHVVLPLVGELHLPSAMAFDVGVFAVVVGATLLILTALAHQSIRAHRRPASGGEPPARRSA